MLATVCGWKMPVGEHSVERKVIHLDKIYIKIHINLEGKFLLTNIVNCIGHPKFVLQNQLYSGDFIKAGTVHICCDVVVNESLTEKITEKLLDKSMRQKMFSVYESGINDSCTLQVEGRSLKVVGIFGR
jgi:hypothetical protein